MPKVKNIRNSDNWIVLIRDVREFEKLRKFLFEIGFEINAKVAERVLARHLELTYKHKVRVDFAHGRMGYAYMKPTIAGGPDYYFKSVDVFKEAYKFYQQQPAWGTRYWYCSDNFVPRWSVFCNMCEDELRWKAGNFFRTRNECCVASAHVANLFIRNFKRIENDRIFNRTGRRSRAAV